VVRSIPRAERIKKNKSRNEKGEARRGGVNFIACKTINRATVRITRASKRKITVSDLPGKKKKPLIPNNSPKTRKKKMKKSLYARRGLTTREPKV